MRVAVFGGTGFIGYDFVRLLLDEHSIEPTVFCSSAQNLTNISRHRLPIQLFSYETMKSDGIDSNYDFIVNFAHPFAARDDLSQNAQIDLLAGAFAQALKENPRLRLIHVSTMSVYEPFAQGRYFEEDSKLAPPETDLYASSKVHFERALEKYPELKDRIFQPRPTIVYGPFCRPWTDGILKAFYSGDVYFGSLDGKVQPLYVRDLSRLIWQSMENFNPGPLNVAGPDAMTWHEFFELFEAIANHGSLQPFTGEVPRETVPTFRSNLVDVVRTVINDPSFQRLVWPIAKHVPKHRRQSLVTRVSNAGSHVAKHDNANANIQFVRQFFGEDRLVSLDRLKHLFPNFSFTAFDDAKSELARYADFRFSDTPMRPQVASSK